MRLRTCAARQVRAATADYLPVGFQLPYPACLRALPLRRSSPLTTAPDCQTTRPTRCFVTWTYGSFCARTRTPALPHPRGVLPFTGTRLLCADSHRHHHPTRRYHTFTTGHGRDYNGILPQLPAVLPDQPSRLALNRLLPAVPIGNTYVVLASDAGPVARHAHAACLPDPMQRSTRTLLYFGWLIPFNLTHPGSATAYLFVTLPPPITVVGFRRCAFARR